jgi:hypothetical protein
MELKRMGIGSSPKKDKRRKVVSMTIRIAPVPAAKIDLSSLNCVANKARDKAWKIGDQAMKKAVYGDINTMTRGCYE